MSWDPDAELHAKLQHDIIPSQTLSFNNHAPEPPAETPCQTSRAPPLRPFVLRDVLLVHALHRYNIFSGLCVTPHGIPGSCSLAVIFESLRCVCMCRSLFYNYSYRIETLEKFNDVERVTCSQYESEFILLSSTLSPWQSHFSLVGASTCWGAGGPVQSWECPSA